MSYFLGIITSLIGCVLIFLHAFFYQAPIIEKDIFARVVSTINSKGVENAKVAVKGRDARVFGNFKSKQDLKRVSANLNSLWGLRKLDIDINTLRDRNIIRSIKDTKNEKDPIPHMSPYTTIITKAKNRELLLEGYCPSEADCKNLFLQAKKTFPTFDLKSSLKTAQIAPTTWEAESKLALRVANMLEYGSVSIIDELFNVEGVVSTNKQRIQVQTLTKAKLSKEMASDISISLFNEVKADVQIKKLNLNTKIGKCQSKINTLTSKRSVSYESSSANLDKAGQGLLKDISGVLSACPGFIIHVNGHTDSTGSAQINKVLSLKRAHAAMNYLASLGISSKRMKGNGFGASRPLKSNNTKIGRKKNRRIEFQLVEEKK